jgi:hypothetical protein
VGWTDQLFTFFVGVNLSRKTATIGAIASALCMVLTVAAVFGQELAFSRFAPSDRLGLSADFNYAESEWAFIMHDLAHIIAFCAFTVVLARGSQTLAWLGTGWLILSSLADMTYVAIQLSFNSQAASSGNGVGSAVPFPGLELMTSTLDVVQAFAGLIGFAFLAFAVFKVSGQARIAGWFVLLGLPLGVVQLIETGINRNDTGFLDIWITPGTEFIQHAALAWFFFTFAFRKHKNLDSFRAPSKPVRNVAQGEIPKPRSFVTWSSS